MGNHSHARATGVIINYSTPDGPTDEREARKRRCLEAFCRVPSSVKTSLHPDSCNPLQQAYGAEERNSDRVDGVVRWQDVDDARGSKASMSA